MTAQATLRERIENTVENKSAQFRLHTIKRHIPTFTAKTIRKEVVTRAWGNVTGTRHKYTIEIGRTDGETFTFSYYDSINAYKTGAKLNLFDAIYCMMLDSNSYEFSKNFEDFVAEFGYATDDEEQLAEAQRVFRACKNTYMNVKRTFNFHDWVVLDASCSQY